jgi:hypothetical protein
MAMRWVLAMVCVAWLCIGADEPRRRFERTCRVSPDDPTYHRAGCPRVPTGAIDLPAAKVEEAWWPCRLCVRGSLWASPDAPTDHQTGCPKAPPGAVEVSAADAEEPWLPCGLCAAGG